MSSAYLLCVGAQKCGTTWLQGQLEQHPDVWMPPSKELHFFNYRHDPEPLRRSKQIMARTRLQMEQGVIPYSRDSIDWLEYAINSEKSGMEWYQSLFPSEGRMAVGDITPAYACMDIKSFKLVFEHYPDARIVFLMRDPVKRFWSAAKQRHTRNNTEKGINRLSNVRHMIRYAEKEGNYVRSRYDWTIQKLEQLFPREQILYGFYEEIFASQRSKLDFLKAACKHLGVDCQDHHFPRVDEVYLKSHEIEMPETLRDYVYSQTECVRTFIKKRFGRLPAGWEHPQTN